MSGVDLLIGAISGALIVISGALYALFFALGRLRHGAGFGSSGTWFIRGAWIAYGALVICTLMLAQALQLDGGWRVIVIFMLVGYLLAPAAIWHLCVGTHGAAETRDSQSAVDGIQRP